MRMRHGLALFLFALFLSACSSMGVTEAPPMVAAGPAVAIGWLRASPFQ